MPLDTAVSPGDVPRLESIIIKDTPPKEIHFRGFDHEAVLQKQTMFNLDTGELTTNGTANQILMIREGGGYKFGREFLADLYLFVNYDNKTFTLWPGAGSQSATQQQLVGVGPNGESFENFCEPSGAPIKFNDLAWDGSPLPESSPLPDHGRGKREAIIGGSVAGSIIISVAVAATGIWWIKRRKRLRAEAQSRGAASTKQDNPHTAPPATNACDCACGLCRHSSGEVETRERRQELRVDREPGEMPEDTKPNLVGEAKVADAIGKDVVTDRAELPAGDDEGWPLSNKMGGWPSNGLSSQDEPESPIVYSAGVYGEDKTLGRMGFGRCRRQGQ